MNEPAPVKTESPTAEPYALPVSIPPWLGWATATACFFAAIFFAAKSFNVRGQLQSVLDDERVARLEAGTLKNLLEAERILSRGQLDHLAAAERLVAELRAQAGIDRLKIAALTASGPAPSSAHATVVWIPGRQEGALVVSKLPAPPPDSDYQLWVTGPSSPALSVAVFTLAPETEETRVNFKFPASLDDAQTFGISLVPKGGAAQPGGPMLLTGAAL
jgi:hypothetical protein